MAAEEHAPGELPGGVRARVLAASGKPVYEVESMVQRLGFPHAATRVRQSYDGAHLIASGVHPPQLGCFQLNDLTEKWRRHVDAEITDLCMVSHDWSKTAVLMEPRTVALHARHGLHATIRVPSFARSLAHSFETATLCIGCSDSCLYRLNLEQGRFLRPVELDEPDGVSCISCSAAHGLVAAGCGSGQLALIDPRMPRKCAAMTLSSGVTAITQHSDNGLSLACGLDDGTLHMFDLRTSAPLATCSHGHATDVRSVQFVGKSNDSMPSELLVSADTRGVRAWYANSGDPFLAFDTRNDVNHCMVYHNSGLVLTAEEGGSVVTRYAPDIGPAPKWCPSIESLPEDVAKEGAPSAGSEHEDFRFVTRDELARLGLEHLQGTSLLKPHMHGFFLHAKLYHRARAVADPDPQRSARRERLQKKMQQQRDTRITMPKRLPKVNRQIAEKYASHADSDQQQQEEQQQHRSGANASTSTENEESKTRKNKRRNKRANELATNNPLTDERFARMFHDKDFEVDYSSHEYQLLHPDSTRRWKQEEEEEEEEEMRQHNDRNVDGLITEHFEADSEGEGMAAPKMYEARGRGSATAYSAGRSVVNEQTLSLAEREKRERENAKRQEMNQQQKRDSKDAAVKSGNRELSFEPQSKTKKARRR